MAKRLQIHEYPSMVEIMEGLMGAGKSYWAVRRMIITLGEQFRPVYTNLPIKHPVLRAYLRKKHGQQVANLINPLTERHWRSFLRRQHQFAEFKQRCDALLPSEMSQADQNDLLEACRTSYADNPPTLRQIQTASKFYVTWIIAWFDKQFGQPITAGPDANHIPPASIIIIDEVQRWHPMMNQSKDPDRMALLSYLTMSRHHAHWVWVLTQDAMNMSIEFRRLAHQIWVIWNRMEDEIAGPLRFRHLSFGGFKVRAMGYARFTHDEYEQYRSSSNADKTRLSVQVFSIITNLPGSKLFYRFYSSETHLGSRRQLMRTLRRGQQAAGVDAEYKKIETPMEETIMYKFVKNMYVLIAFVLLAVGGFFVGKQTADPPPQTKQVERVPQWPKWTMLSQTPWIGGRPLKVGQSIGDTNATLRYIADDYRSLVLVLDDEYWLWNFGSVPIRVGPIEDVRAAVERIRASESRDGGPAVPVARTDDR